MLRVLGILCIFLASGGMAYVHICGMRREIVQLGQLMEWLHVLEQELRYCRSPLPEMFQQLGGQLTAPWQQILQDTAGQMRQYEQASVSEVWKTVCEGYRDLISLKETDYQRLLQMGEIFSFRSLESSLQLIELYIHHFSESREGRREEYGNRKKLCCCICYLTGFFVVVLLL